MEQLLHMEEQTKAVLHEAAARGETGLLASALVSELGADAGERSSIESLLEDWKSEPESWSALEESLVIAAWLTAMGTKAAENGADPTAVGSALAWALKRDLPRYCAMACYLENVEDSDFEISRRMADLLTEAFLDMPLNERDRERLTSLRSALVS
jgi:hypothetical protein